MQTYATELGTAAPARLFVRYALPGIAGVLLIGLQSIVDGALLGRFVSANAMAAVSVAMPCFGLVIALGLAVGVGCGCIIAIRSGEGRHQEAADAFATAFRLAIGLSTVWAVVLLLWGPAILTLLGANEVLLPDCLAYTQALAWFFPSVALLMLGDYTLKALGRPLRAMFLLGAMVVLNVILDLIAIVGLGWGVGGAALATGISCTLSALLIFIPLLHPRTSPVRGGHFRTDLIMRMLYNGSSEGLAEMATGLTILMFNRVMVVMAGAAGVAAFSALNYLQFTAMAIFLGMADGISPVIGYNFGLGRPDRIRAMLRLALGFVLVCGACLWAAMFWGGQSLISLFFDSATPNNAAAAAHAASGARLFAFAMPLCGFNVLISGYFTAIGNARISALVSLSHGLVLVLAGLLILPRLWGMTGVWLTVPMAEAITVLPALFLFRRSLRAGAEHVCLPASRTC